MNLHKPNSGHNLPCEDNILRQSFANGSTFLAYENPASPAVFFSGYLPAGSLGTERNKAGLASLCASTLLTGNQKADFQTIHDRIEGLGANLAFSSGPQITSFSGQCLCEDLPFLFDLLLQSLSQPSFPEEHFQRLRAQSLTALALQAEESAEMADQAFDRQLYGEHPYAIPEMGSVETINSLKVEDLVDFHKRFYGPNGLTLSISGGIQPEEALRIFAQSLGTWEKKSQEAMPTPANCPPLRENRREHVSLQDKSQSDLVIGTFAPSVQHPDWLSCSLGNNILGEFGMMGRIGKSVREKSGLAYYAQSILGSSLGPASWQVVAGINPKNLNKAIALIKKEITRFVSEAVSAQELDDSVSQTIGRLPVSLETNTGIAMQILRMQRLGQSLNYLLELPDRLHAISPDQILSCAQRYWNPEALVIASAGKALK